MFALPGLVRVVTASVTRVGRAPALAVLAVLLVAVGAVIYLSAAPGDNQLTAVVLVGRN